MKRLRVSRAVWILLAASAQIIGAQMASRQASSRITGSVENAAGQLRLNLTNADQAREFRGTAHISVGTTTEAAEAPKVTFVLAPQETRVIPLSAAASTEQATHFTLTIYRDTGALVYFRTAPIAQITDSPTVNSAPVNVTAPTAAALASHKDEVQVRARLLGGPAAAPFGGTAELPVEAGENQLLLVLEVSAPSSILEARLNLRAKGFEQSQSLTIQGQARAEFKLPAAFNERKLQYTLTDHADRVLARGEADLEQLAHEDSTTVSEVKLDRPAYTPGEMARVVVMLAGTSGYRLEFSAKDEQGRELLRDLRQGVNVGGKSSQEFTLELPPAAKSLVFFEFKVYGGQTGTLFDTSQRVIALTEASQSPGSLIRRAP